MISSITSVPPNSWYPTNTHVEKSNKESLFSVYETKELNENQPTSLNIWEELSETYDVRNATFHDIKNVAQTLYKVGEISGRDVATLTFDYEKATNDIQRYSKASVSANFNMYETVADKLNRRDWISEFEARTTNDLKYGNLIGHANKSKILNILYKLEK